MKNKLIILGLIFSVTFSSCTDWLNPKPLDTMVMEDFWKTKDDVESMVYACYEAMTQKAYMQRVILAGEGRSDNVTKGTKTDDGGLNELLNASIQPTNSYAKWQAFYKVINYCNNVIKYAPGVRERDPDYTQGLLNIDLAEAHTLRALTYFYLARFYKEFPYIVDPYTDDTQNFNIKASPGDSVINEELILLAKVAEPGAVRTRGNSLASGLYLSNPMAVKNKGRITKTSVRTLMADMYLWIEKYDECITMCNKVLDDVLTKDQYTLADKNLLTGTELYLIPNDNSDKTGPSESYRSIFMTKNSPESIFELQFNSYNLEGDPLSTAITDAYGSSNHTRWFNAPSKLFTDNWLEFADSDLRKTDNLFKPGTEDSSPVLPVKRVGFRIIGSATSNSYGFYNSSSSINWIFYRLSEVYLMKAEALIEQRAKGENNYSDEDIVELINVTYSRSNPGKSLNPQDYSGIDALRELLLLERQRELIFEGKRWFDLLRFARREKSTANVLSKYILRKYDYNQDVVLSKLSDMDSFYMPIHKEELISNTQLDQNPFYINVLQ